MSGNFTDYAVNGWLDEIATSCYAALHFDDPTLAGAYASEYSGDGYTRVKIQFSRSDNRTMWNANSIIFAGLDAGTIAFLGGWNAQVNGDLVWWTRLETPKRLLRGQGYIVNPAEIAVSFG